MTILASLLPALSILPTIAAIPTYCHPYANFSLTADAPGTAVDGLTMFAQSVNHELSFFPSNPTSDFSDNSHIFFKNDTTRLYVWLSELNGGPNPVLPQQIVSPLAGDLMATPDPANYEFPHYEEYFTPSVEVWPPSSHLMFKPGTLINPGTFGDQGPSPGGWFACLNDGLQEYFVYGATALFRNESLSDSPECIEFKPKINLLGFSTGC